MDGTTTLKKGDILIVDDTPNNLRLLSTLLQNHDYEARSVLSGEMALRAARSAAPDLILLDISMPIMDGYEVCRKLKADTRTREVPVIFISAFNEAMDKVRAFEVGGVDYITKPFQWAEVLVRVENQLKIRSLQTQLLAQNAQLQQEIQERLKVEYALQAANQKLQNLANSDGLTGAANRRRFDEYLQMQWEELQQQCTPLSLILCDVDYFKRYNDTYGHLAGDSCLQAIVRGIEEAIVQPEQELIPKILLARYGGEEFAIVIPHADRQLAYKVAREIHEAVQQLQIAHSQSSIGEWVTVSVGVATTIPAPSLDPKDLIARADDALYAAKAQGRDRVVADETLKKN
ncbi:MULTISPECIES: diguanylate cyclase [Spirulina sp. CCY15215]|uniref:diguanylate cyclase domain-containing protein n=1 Tax=Spirulina sp. CCY15215 TaxID=2767591 RepID=UPI00194FB248|nr:diguanylate cyclase [Spirulina major]